MNPESTVHQASRVESARTRASRGPWRRLALLLAWVGVFVLSGCNATPDKRVLQYLNTDGFGNRYSGNAEEENWVALGDQIGIDDPNVPELRIESAVVDIDGNFASCIIYGDDPAGLKNENYDRAADPSFDASQCVNGVNTMTN